jgi:hypothetical protein
MPYVINKKRQIISVGSKVIVNNQTGELPVKVYNNVVKMTNRKLYWINLFGIVAPSTLIKIERLNLDPIDCDDEYVVQQFFDEFVIVDDKLFSLRINADLSRDPFTIRSLAIDNVHNLDNIKVFNYGAILFVTDDNNLMLKQSGQVYLLDQNVFCKKLCVYCWNYHVDGFFVTLCFNHKIIFRNYKKNSDNNGCYMSFEHEFPLGICVEQICPRMLIDTNGRVYQHKFNYFIYGCLFRDNYDNIVTQHNIRTPIREIFYYEDIYYYLSYDEKIIDSDGNVIMSNIYGSRVPKTGIKSANF